MEKTQKELAFLHDLYVTPDWTRRFAELADIRADYVTKIEGPPEKHLALAEPLSCVSHAKQWVDPSPGERVLVVGAGGLGSPALLYLI